MVDDRHVNNAASGVQIARQMRSMVGGAQERPVDQARHRANSAQVAESLAAQQLALDAIAQGSPTAAPDKVSGKGAAKE